MPSNSVMRQWPSVSLRQIRCLDRQVMGMVTKFGVLPIFRGLGGKLSPQRVVQARSADQAKSMATTFAMVMGGAVAFSKHGNPDSGQWDEAIILECCGDVPTGINAGGF
jgi:hypothetical protein